MMLVITIFCKDAIFFFEFVNNYSRQYFNENNGASIQEKTK